MKKITSNIIAMLLCLQSMHSFAVDASPGYEIGVYYYPGWKEDQVGAVSAKPWQVIKEFPELEPMLGWYPEGSVSVAEQQLQWMHDYGIDYVVYDWYWDGKRTYLEHGLAAYFQAFNNNLVKFSLLWANHDGRPRSLDEFTDMVRYWVSNYFPREQYLRIDGKPVVFVFSAQMLLTESKKFGKTTKELLQLADELAKEKGLPGIYFVAGGGAVAPMANQYAPKNGYNALSAYNYHNGSSGKYIPNAPVSHSYEELDTGYREHWNWILKNSPLPYIVPMTSGWDKRPWGGSKDSLHDNSISSPESFEQHLRAGKALMDKYPGKSIKTGVICCWNEFGEGSYIEPTKKDGFSYLEKVKKVFGSP